MTDVADGIDPLLDPMADAVGYDAAILTYTVYSEDVSLIGLKDLTTTAFLVNYPQIMSDVT